MVSSKAEPLKRAIEDGGRMYPRGVSPGLKSAKMSKPAERAAENNTTSRWCHLVHLLTTLMAITMPECLRKIRSISKASLVMIGESAGIIGDYLLHAGQKSPNVIFFLHMLRSLTSWIFSPHAFEVIALFAFGIGVALALSPGRDDVAKAHYFFAIGFLLALGRTAQMLVEWEEPPAIKYVAFFLCFGLIGIAWFAVYGWVDRKLGPAPAPASDTDASAQRGLNGKIRFFTVSEFENNATFTLAATLTNLGPPTTARDFSLFADMAGRSLRAKVLMVPDGAPITLHLDDGTDRGAVIIMKSLAEQAAHQQIATGGELTGTLVYALDGISKQDFEKAAGKVRLTYADTFGNPHEIIPPDSLPTTDIPYIPGISIAPKPKGKLDNSTRVKTLREYYNTDFEHADVVGINVEHRMQDEERGEQIDSYAKVFGDWNAHTSFISFFVPASDPTYRMCVFYSVGYKPTLASVVKSPVRLRATAPGSTREMLFEDLKFSGRIFIYHEGPLTQAEEDELRALYKSRGLTLELRGPEYMAARNEKAMQQ